MSNSLLAINAAFAAFGTAATYRAPDSAATTACTVIFDVADQDIPHGDMRAVAAGMSIEVRLSEVALPVKGGSFMIPPVDGVRYDVISTPKSIDVERLVWTMAVRK